MLNFTDSLIILKNKIKEFIEDNTKYKVVAKDAKIL